VADAARPAPPALRIQVCGPLVLERDGRRVDARLPGRQGRLLCGYLVLNRHRPVQRSELITALWPAAPPGNADSGLSALLSKLRPVLGPDVLAVHHAESAIARGDWHRAWAPAQIALFAAVRVGARIVEVAPFRESGYRLLMRALAAQGNQAEALRIYDGLRATLRDQLGVSPSPASQELFAQLNR